MEYFNFDDASHFNGLPDFDEISSTCPEVNEGDVQSCFEALFFDKSSSLPTDQPAQIAPPSKTTLDTRDVEIIPHPDDLKAAYPMFRAKEPCDLCRKMGLDCFISQRGVMLHGCTCCISLYRECSFTHQKQPGGFMTTFPGISEDAMVGEGAISGRRALKSYDDSRPRKNGARFCRDAVKILKSWLAEHSDHPYPTDREKDELKQLTGLKRSQISNWLANARRRGKVRPTSAPSSPVLGAIDIPQKSSSSKVEMQDLNPLERWKASPPEHEPASATAIARAIAGAPLVSGRNSSQSSLQGSRKNSSRNSSSNDDSNLSMFQAPSISSLETGRSSTSDISFVSGRSHRSRGSLTSSLGDKDRRRRRRAPAVQRVSAQLAKSRGARIFQCTFCTDTFPAKYDWQRHEKSLHLGLERWTCCPNGGTLDIDGLAHCIFCGDTNPTQAHLEGHNFTACQEKTLQERTFYRKDHLRQHLKLSHGTKFDPWMEAWKSTTSEIKSKCGFCPQLFATWQQRADHLAAHFRNGSDMRDWSGGWGLEPYVERLVENAMPPYLIAQERITLDPFVARPQTTPNSADESNLTFGTSAFGTPSDEYQIDQDSNCWRRLEQGLSSFISQQKQLGVIPTDQMLQDKGRMIIYNDDDPWNQTAADNQQWLDCLKAQHGIARQSQPDIPRLEELPMMPPYTVRGGLKNGHPGTGVSTRKANGSFTPNLSDLPISTALMAERAMDFDFDQLDFGNLDLGLVDDMDLDAPIQMQAIDIAGSVSQAETIPAFPTFEMQQDQAEKENLISERDLHQLSGYRAGFQ